MLECESSTQLRSVQLERFLFLRSEFGEEILIKVFSYKIELIIIREKEKLISEFTSLELIRVASFGGFQQLDSSRVPSTAEYEQKPKM